MSEISPSDKCLLGIVLGIEDKAVNKIDKNLSWRLRSNGRRQENKTKYISHIVDAKCYEEKQDRARRMGNAELGVGAESLNRVVSKASSKR